MQETAPGVYEGTGKYEGGQYRLAQAGETADVTVTSFNRSPGGLSGFVSAFRSGFRGGDIMSSLTRTGYVKITPSTTAKAAVAEVKKAVTAAKAAPPAVKALAATPKSPAAVKTAVAKMSPVDKTAAITKVLEKSPEEVAKMTPAEKDKAVEEAVKKVQAVQAIVKPPPPPPLVKVAPSHLKLKAELPPVVLPTKSAQKADEEELILM